MATANLLVDGNATVTGWGFAGSSAWEAINEDPQSGPSDADYIVSPSAADGEASFTLQALPADWAGWDAATADMQLRIRARAGTIGNDTITIFVMVKDSAGNILVNEQNMTTIDALDTSFTIYAINAGTVGLYRADAAKWADARVHIRVDWSAVMGADTTAEVQISAVAVGGNYTPAGTFKAGADASAAGSDSATVTTSVSGSDVDGTNQEATLVALVPAADTSGGTSESGELGAQPKVGTDASAAATDSGSPTAAQPGSDASGAVTETSALNQTKDGSDTGSGATQTGSVVAAEPGSDASSPASETATSLASAAAGDVNGAVSEASGVVQRVDVIGTDAVGPPTEAGARDASLASAESGSASDLASLISILSGADVGSGASQSAFATTFALGADVNGSVQETATYRTDVIGADAGSAAQLASLIAAMVVADVSGATVESGTYHYFLVSGDIDGAGAETASVLVMFFGADVSGTGADTAIVSVVTIQAADSGSGSDNGIISGTTVMINGADAGSAAQLATISSIISGEDISTGVQLAATAVAAQGDDVAASVVQSAIISALMIAAEQGAGGDLATISYSPAGADAETGSEGAVIRLYGADIAGIGLEFGSPVVSAAAEDVASALETVESLLVQMQDLDSGISIENGLKLIRGILTAIPPGRIAEGSAGKVISQTSSGEVS